MNARLSEATMKRSKLFLTFRIIALISLGALFAFLIDYAFRPSWTPNGFRKVELGMTLQEVETILGGPPGDYCSREYEIVCVGTYPRGSGPPNSRKEIWFDDCHRFEIYFDDQNRVVGLNERFQFIRELPSTRWGRLWHQFMNSLN